MKKKIISLALVVAMVAIMLTSFTLAYFTDKGAATNVITMGDVSIWLAESKYHRGATGDSYLKMDGQPEPLQDSDIIKDSETYHNDYLQKAKLMPFNLSEPRVQDMFEECTVAKNAYVMNTSETGNDCFVRVRYLIPATIAPYLDIFYTDTQFLVDDGNGNYTANSTSVKAEWAKADARTLNNDDKAEPMITTVNSGAGNAAAQIVKTVERGGKTYYSAEFIYAERLKPAEMTLYSPISKITLVPTVTNEIAATIADENGQFTILVEAEAIQADGFLNAVDAFKAWN